MQEKEGGYDGAGGGGEDRGEMLALGEEKEDGGARGEERARVRVRDGVGVVWRGFEQMTKAGNYPSSIGANSERGRGKLPTCGFQLPSSARYNGFRLWGKARGEK